MPPTDLPLLDWSPGQVEASLAALFTRLRKNAYGQIEWYTQKRRGKRWLAIAARNGALLSLGVAALLPLIATVYPAIAGSQASLQAVWVSIVVALAAGFVAYDRAQGFSSGWVRFVQTELQLRDALELFELDWEIHRSAFRGQQPTPSQVESMLQLARTFSGEINTTVLSETNAWIEEFQSTTRNLDETLKARIAEGARKRDTLEGAANIVITNGDDFTDGWKLVAANRAPTDHKGKTAAVTALPVGIVIFKVSALLNGKEKHAELAAPIAAGATANVSITL